MCRTSTSYTALPNVVATFDVHFITQNKKLIWYLYESKFEGEYNSNVSQHYSYVTLYNKMRSFDYYQYKILLQCNVMTFDRHNIAGIASVSNKYQLHCSSQHNCTLHNTKQKIIWYSYEKNLKENTILICSKVIAMSHCTMKKSLGHLVGSFETSETLMFLAFCAL